MTSDSSWASGYASLLSAVETVPFACPSPFGPADRYQLVELAAMTTRSWVYRATDESFAADGEAPTVAIKISRLPGHPSEAFLGRKVEHDGVVRLTDHGRTADGHGYVVMDWIDGGDLGSSEVPWEARDAARFAARLARTVQAAHSALVVHCDLKPSNVLLTRDREPRLADFDLAQRVTDVGGGRKGTLAFMAPEQFRGDPGNGVQSDVYAIGGILHFMLTGAAPHGDDPVDIAARLEAGELPACAGVDKSLARIVRRALAPDLSARYATAHELAVDLERWLAHRPLEWQAPGPLLRLRLWSRRRPAVAVALSAVLLGTAATGAARWEWVRRERLRDEEVAARSEHKAREKVDSVSAGVRGMVLKTARMLVAEKRSQMNNEEVLASLAVMQWLDVPIPGRAEKTADSMHQYGVDVWTELLARADRPGEEPDSLTLFARINLARLAVESGDCAAALKHVTLAEQQWGERLSEGDSAKVALRVIRAIVNAGLGGQPPLTPAARSALEAEAKRVGIGESLLRHLRQAGVGVKDATPPH